LTDRPENDTPATAVAAAPDAPAGLGQGGLQERRDALLETTQDALATGDGGTLRLVLHSQHAADLAELLFLLEEQERAQCLDLLAPGLAAAVLTEIEPATAASVVEDLPDRQLSGLVEEMAPDDAADVLGDLPDEQSERVLSMLDASDASAVRDLMGHAEDTGGGIMTSRVVALDARRSVRDAIQLLRDRAAESEEEPLALFVTGEGGGVLGTVSLHRLLLAQSDDAMASLVVGEPITVRADLDQEEIAEIFADYDLLVLPVVDEAGRLVGQVTVDDILDVIHEEATEDNLKMAATSSEEMEERHVLGVMRRRLPWLALCLAGTLLSGAILDLFSDLLATLGALVLFVPAIMAMGGNSGIQTSTVTVRSLATGLLHRAQVRRTLWRELRVALGMGLILGLVVFAVAWLWTGGGGPVAPCAGLAMLAAVVLSAVLGATIPLVCRALGIDPAVASGPLITTVNDVLSLAIYFGVATLLLRLWPLV
jgi:magnesium transporter